jgi:hypothetical protein
LAVGWAVLLVVALLNRQRHKVYAPKPLPRWTPFQWGVLAVVVTVVSAALATLAGRQSRWPITSQTSPRTAWHDLSDLITRLVGDTPPLTQAPIGQVALAIVTTVVVWLISVVYLQRVLFPDRPALALAGVLLALAFSASPAAMPPAGLPGEGAAIALVPGLIAWSVQLARVARLRSGGRAPRLLALALGLVGMGMAHPFGVIVYLTIALPGAVALVARWTARSDRTWLHWLLPFAVACSGVAVAAVVAASAMHSHLMKLPDATGAYVTTVLAPAAAVADWTTYFPWWPNVLVAWLVVVGILTAAVEHRGRRAWLAVAYGLAVAWYVVAARVSANHSSGHFHWYLSTLYLAPLLGLIGLPLAAMALGSVSERWRDLANDLIKRWQAGTPAQRLWSRPTPAWHLTFSLIEVLVLSVGVVALAGAWVGRLVGWLVL